jgi:hypothetical protein
MKLSVQQPAHQRGLKGCIVHIEVRLLLPAGFYEINKQGPADRHRSNMKQVPVAKAVC